MLARKIILGFGLAIVIPMLVHFGVDLLNPKPKFSDYDVKNYYEKHQRASVDEQIQLEEEKNKQDDQYRSAQRNWRQTLFYFAVPIGIIIVILGSMICNHAVGSGMMLGGIFTFTDGCFWFWHDLEPVGRFIALLCAFLCLIWIGHVRLRKEANS